MKWFLELIKTIAIIILGEKYEENSQEEASKENNQEVILDPLELQKQIIAFIDGLIRYGSSNPFNKMAYMNYRETGGKNRSPELDQMIARHGYDIGSAYCMIGIQDILRATEKQFNIKFDLPKTGSTQSFYNRCNPLYTQAFPQPYFIGIYQKGKEHKGHAVLCLSKVHADNSYSSFEFNTSPDLGPEIIRDGQGAYFKTRPLHGYGDMKLKGFVDIFKAIKK